MLDGQVLHFKLLAADQILKRLYLSALVLNSDPHILLLGVDGILEVRNLLHLTLDLLLQSDDKPILESLPQLPEFVD